MDFNFAWIIQLLILTSLELVLGIDNIVLLTILVERLPKEKQEFARKLGLGLALGARLVLLASAVWLSKLTTPLFSVFNTDITIRGLVLIFGGLFLMAKATTEIFHHVELKDEHGAVKTRSTFAGVIFQIVVFDLIFSLDSVLTAIGLSQDLTVMTLAVVISIIFMMIFARAIGQFVTNNPGIKMLALSFLVMIGVLLLAEGFGSHFDRGYVYFSMAFSLLIEVLNRRRAKKYDVLKKI